MDNIDLKKVKKVNSPLNPKVGGRVEKIILYFD